MQVMPPTPGGGPSRLFILRPVATTLLMIAILLAGIIGYRSLPVSALPEVDSPTIQVVTLFRSRKGVIKPGQRRWLLPLTDPSMLKRASG